MRKFDLIIIGGGPGGYHAALEGVRLGFSVALIDKVVGAVPAYIAGVFPQKSFGPIQNFYYGHLLCKSQGRKNKVVETLCKGLEQTLKQKGIALIQERPF